MGIAHDITGPYVNHVDGIYYNNKIYVSITRAYNNQTSVIIMRKHLDTGQWEQVHEFTEKDEGKGGYSTLVFLPDGSLWVGLSNRNASDQQIFAEALLMNMDVPWNSTPNAVQVSIAIDQTARDAITQVQGTLNTTNTIANNALGKANSALSQISDLSKQVTALKSSTSNSTAFNDYINATLANNTPLSAYIWQKALDAAYTTTNDRFIAIESHLQNNVDVGSINAAINDLQLQVSQLSQAVYELTNKVNSLPTKEYIDTYIDSYFTSMHTFTTASTPLGYEVLNIEGIVKLFPVGNPNYTEYDVRSILTGYNAIAQKANLNPYLLVAQMALETDWLRSWWSNRPRRNPAGLGVTGETKATLAPTDNKAEWQLDTTTNIYKKGLAFVDWTKSASAHSGHVLAYFTTDDKLTADQKAILATDPRANLVKRGSATTLSDLNGTWAVDTAYADKIVTIANKLKGGV